MSKSELWKEQTGCRLGNAFSNDNKNKQQIYCPRLMRNVFRLAFFVARSECFKTHFSFADPARPVGKLISHLLGSDQACERADLIGGYKGSKRKKTRDANCVSACTSILNLLYPQECLSLRYRYPNALKATYFIDWLFDLLKIWSL